MLTRLGLDQNQLSGPIPSELGALVELKHLRLNDNELSGVVPESFASLRRLLFLSVDPDIGTEYLLPFQQQMAHASMPVAVRDIADLINDGESKTVEFKQTLRGYKKEDKKPEQAVLKAIAGFLNTYGGTLIIGLKDDSSPAGKDDSPAKGILHETDFFKEGEDTISGRDEALKFLSAIARQRVDANIWDAIDADFIEHSGALLLAVRCKSVADHDLFPVWVQDVGSANKHLYRRGSNESVELHGDDMLAYRDYVIEFKTPPAIADDD